MNKQDKIKLTNLYEGLERGDISSNVFMNYLTYSMKEKNVEIGEVKCSKERIENLLEQLDQLIGLNNVKTLIYEIIAYAEIQQRRRKEGLNAFPLVMHMIFKGNPGTGKTTVARLLGKIFKAMGTLQNGHLIEVERADLVGEYIGHTAIKVREQVKKALGGILFIDEAYSLARGGEKDFGKEAIDALVKSMEDHKDNFILILAGYKDEMENFLKINPGLKSRFPIHIDFEDYTLEELVEIAELMVATREYTLSKSAKAKLYNLLAIKRKQDGDLSGNARLVRNLIEKAIRKQAVRLKKNSFSTRNDLIFLIKEDFLDGEE